MAESLSELLREEFETLQSIYQDDDNFRIVDTQTLTYKFAPAEKDFIVQFELTPDYPDAVPTIHMEILYNTKLSSDMKAAIVGALESEARQLVGTQMLYSLLEWGRDNLEEVIAQCNTESAAQGKSLQQRGGTAHAGKQEKKEHLTKAAKRKLADKTDVRGEHARGWDWVDVIKHLSKTGSS